MSILDGPSPSSILAPPSPPVPAAPAAPKFRDLGNNRETRTGIWDNVLSAAQGVQPISNRDHTLRLTDVDWVDPDEYKRKDQKDAILRGRTLARRLKGTWELVDNATGQTLDKKPMTIARVPYMTDHGTFIYNGTETSLRNQQRLLPGIFARQKSNGELEAHVNVLPGKGLSHRYFLDPAKGTFNVQVRQSNLPLMPLLKAMGTTDAELRNAWGNEIYAANMRKDDPAVLNKLFTRLVGKKEVGDLDSRRKMLVDAVQAMQLDPIVTKRTLGQPFANLSKDAILETTRKLLAISRGEADVDDRDALANQTVMGPEDLIAERIAKDAGGVRRNMLWKSSFRRNLSGVLSGALNKQIDSAVLHSGLGNSLEETNPSDIFDKQYSISRLGEGGIPSLDAIPMEARAVQPSHLGFMDPLRTPESFRVGVDVYLANSVRKGTDGRIYTPLIDVSSGQTVYKSPQDIAEQAITFPGEMNRPTKRIRAIRNGKLEYVPKSEISFAVPHFEGAFSPLGNLVPFKSGVKGQRVAMASRMLTQALPLLDPESPLVQAGVPNSGGRSYEQEYAKHMGAVHADQSGRVTEVTPDSIRVQYDDGTKGDIDLYDNYPYNRRSYIHNTTKVQPGQTFGKGDLLATSNFTDPQGVTALGKNLKVGYVPFRGMNFEDAIVISEAAAKRLTSEHMYQHGVEWDDRTKRGKNNFMGIFPGKFSKDILSKMDEDGVIRKGEQVNFGEPLVLAAKQREMSQNKVHRRKEAGFEDSSDMWKHHLPGIVTDVLKTDKGSVVLVKSTHPMQVGDKMSGRYGDKGVVSLIVPDHEMPTDKDGTPMEVLLNPLGINSRGNPAQVLEAVLGKIAHKTGQAYRVPDFDETRDNVQFAQEELRKFGLPDTEDLIDPGTGNKIPGVLTGHRFFMKLHHTAEGKGQGRGTGAYTQTGEPARGGEAGAKMIGLMDNNAILSHGALEVRRDAAAIRGQRNEEFWVPFLQGYTPPKPKVPMVYQKFLNELQAAGVHVTNDGGRLNIMALTNKDVDRLAGERYIENSNTVRLDEGLKPIKGGLFDPTLTGGHNGNQWAAIRLSEPMVNPVMEEPARRLLGLTKEGFMDVISGKKEIDSLTGPAAIQHALGRINVPKAIDEARAQISGGRKTYRDEAIRKLGYLKTCQEKGINPADWVLTKVPVLPPAFRPISVMQDTGIPLVADPNYLYKELIDANDNLTAMRKESNDIGDERLAVYQAFKAVTGLGDPVHPKLVEKNVKGLLEKIFGSSPKFSTVQRKLLSGNVDLVGRAVITPNPDLDMDHVGLPENKAWELYRNFIVRRLRRRGLPVVEAARQVENKSPLAKQEMLQEMADRPVIISRAPVLHRFGIQAFYPKLMKGDTMRISPLVVGGFGADFDGDAMNYHVPVGEEARKEAIDRMLPSRNLFSPADFKTPVHKPTHEYVGGLYAASTGANQKRPPAVFRNKADAIQAYRRGQISADTRVVIMQ